MKGKNIKLNIKEALDNENIRGALGRFADAYIVAREAAYNNKDFQSLREEVSGIKREAVENMEVLACRFGEEVRKKGVHFYRAGTAGEARDYILNLALERGVKTIVKSKSMASEEIHLNDYLSDAGLTVVETDLGEWIIQLSGQCPSHMVMPAIHMTRREVADVFSKETMENHPPDIPRLVKVARNNLRRRFLTAEMGITGANIVVAETGTVVIVTNEGNARLTSTLPPLHVVIVGLEKFVTRFSDVAPILEALPRSATAQKITSYVTMLTGPAQAVDAVGNPVDKEMHIVLLDNGRTEMQQDPIFKEALQCIRCASCLNVCPVYQLIGGHVFGYVYTGGIGTILTAFFNGMENSEKIQSLCIGCGRCREFCPAKINLPHLLAELRHRVVREVGLPLSQRILLKKVLINRKIFHSLLRAAAVAQKPFVSSEGTVRHIPFFLAGMEGGKNLPAIAGHPLRERLKVLRESTATKPHSKVALFAGCLVDFVYPEIGEAMNKVLEHMGYNVAFPEGQTCCGYPARQMGAADVMIEVARHNLEVFSKIGVETILTPCPTCTHALKNLYRELFVKDSVWGGIAEGIAERVYDFAHFVYRQRAGSNLQLKPLNEKVTYHDSCHLKRSLGITREPRELLRMVGADPVEMLNADHCCGFGGSYAMKYPELSGPILDQKLACIRDTGASTVAVECPGCLMQLRRGLAGAQGENVPRAKHLAEILAERV